MSKRKKKSATPPIRGLSVAGGVLDEAYNDPDIESAVTAAVTADPINDLVTQPITGYATPSGGLMQFVPGTWEKPDEKKFDPIADIQASVDYMRKNYTRSVTMHATNPEEHSNLLELLMNEARRGSAIVLPNDMKFEYSESPLVPEPDDGLRRPEMK